MADLKKWMPAAVALACLLVWSAGSAWAKDDVRPGSTRAHITVNDTVHGVLSSHRSLMSIKENRSVLEHELNKARAGFAVKLSKRSICNKQGVFDSLDIFFVKSPSVLEQSG